MPGAPTPSTEDLALREAVASRRASNGVYGAAEEGRAGQSHADVEKDVLERQVADAANRHNKRVAVLPCYLILLTFACLVVYSTDANSGCKLRMWLSGFIGAVVLLAALDFISLMVAVDDIEKSRSFFRCQAMVQALVHLGSFFWILVGIVWICQGGQGCSSLLYFTCVALCFLLGFAYCCMPCAMLFLGTGVLLGMIFGAAAANVVTEEKLREESKEETIHITIKQ